MPFPILKSLLHRTARYPSMARPFRIILRNSHDYFGMMSILDVAKPRVSQIERRPQKSLLPRKAMRNLRLFILPDRLSSYEVICRNLAAHCSESSITARHRTTSLPSPGTLRDAHIAKSFKFAGSMRTANPAPRSPASDHPGSGQIRLEPLSECTLGRGAGARAGGTVESDDRR